jgi:hypothetical protein
MQQPMNMNVDLNSTTEIKCENCGNDTFIPIFYLRKVSKLISPDGNDRILPIDTLACLKCNHVNKDFIPVPKQPKQEK